MTLPPRCNDGVLSFAALSRVAGAVGHATANGPAPDGEEKVL
jgi:hypothetical protein